MKVRPGSHLANLLYLLSVSGEFPSKSLNILGDERTMKAMVHKMESAHDFRLNSDDTILRTKLFQLSGKSGDRTIRLYKGALGILNELHPNALEYYMKAFPYNRFSGNQSCITRNHRVGEAMVVCMMAGINVFPYMLPKLQKESIQHIVLKEPCFYISRHIKSIMESEYNKTKFTRVAGLMFCPGVSYAVYNARNDVMNWSGDGEIRAMMDLSAIVRMNAANFLSKTGHIHEVSSVLLMGTDANAAMKTLIGSDTSRKQHTRMDKIYPYVHFVPLNRDGADLVRILTLPDWNERLLRVLFKPEQINRGYSSVEFDARYDGRYAFSHLDSDIARIIRFRDVLKIHNSERGAEGREQMQFDVVCFTWQAEFLRKYLGGLVRLRPVDMGRVLKVLRI